MKKKLNVDIVPSIRKLEVVTKGLIRTKGFGSYKSVFRGKGLEFLEYRPYDRNDDSSMIDWKASMRANQLLIRQYAEERDINVFFLIDCSSSMVFGSTPKLKNEYAAELVASLSFSILDAGDSVGMAMFNDRIVKQIYPNRGRGQFYTLVRNLVNPNLYGGSYNFKEVADFVLNYLKETTVVIIVSDFVGFNEDLVKHLEFVTSKFDTIGLMVRDPRDRTLPDDVGQVVIEDPYSNKDLLIEPGLIKEVYEDEIRRQEKWVKDLFLKDKSDFLLLTTDKSFVQPILSLFKERALKWR
ncbi:DUF58 domain-containing protein [Candidatus Woesearchaeota archaeon]|nr:DUF58 domain-containing protein [Candidatus Woesearchaeota archaeon]